MTVDMNRVNEPTTTWIDPGSDRTAEIIANIHEIGPFLREQSRIADDERKMTAAAVEAIKSTGAWSISAMERFGGLDGGARMLFEVARTLGYYCPSAGWVTVITNGSVMLANRFDDELLDEMWSGGDPSMGMASVFASPSGEAVRDGDGWRVTGSWPFASNIMDSEWAIGILNLKESADADPYGIGFAMMRRDQYTIKDTWQVIGMRGTGSNTMVTEDLWIPDNRLISFERMMGTDFEADADAPLARRMTPHLTMATTIAAPSVGATQAALDFVRSKAPSRGVTFTTYGSQADSGAFRQGIGEASAKIDTAVLMLERSADAIDAYRAGTTPMPRELRARYRGGLGHAVHSLADAMNDLVWLHGTASFAEFSPLGKLWRDVNTGVRHATISAPVNYEVHGCGLLGTDYIATKL